MEKYYTFKDQKLENGLSWVTQAIGNILLQRLRASTKKHKEQPAKARAKGVDPTESQGCYTSFMFNLRFNKM